MLIKDVMTKAPACCHPHDKLDAVAQLMVEHDCGEIPICDGTRLVGVITDRDITCRGVAAGLDPTLVPVRELMTHAVRTVLPEDRIEAAMELMEESHVRRLPVVDWNGRVVGIVSATDLVAALPSARSAELVKTITRRRGTQALARIG